MYNIDPRNTEMTKNYTKEYVQRLKDELQIFRSAAGKGTSLRTALASDSSALKHDDIDRREVRKCTFERRKRMMNYNIERICSFHGIS